jgi:hypothetical protein
MLKSHMLESCILQFNDKCVVAVVAAAAAAADTHQPPLLVSYVVVRVCIIIKNFFPFSLLLIY